jgi:hypothetical protein
MEPTPTSDLTSPHYPSNPNSDLHPVPPALTHFSHTDPLEIPPIFDGDVPSAQQPVLTLPPAENQAPRLAQQDTRLSLELMPTSMFPAAPDDQHLAEARASNVPLFDLHDVTPIIPASQSTRTPAREGQRKATEPRTDSPKRERPPPPTRDDRPREKINAGPRQQRSGSMPPTRRDLLPPAASIPPYPPPSMRAQLQHSKVQPQHAKVQPQHANAQRPKVNEGDPSPPQVPDLVQKPPRTRKP